MEDVNKRIQKFQLVDSDGVIVDPALNLSGLQLIIDDFTTPGVTYFGRAEAGAAKNEEKWQIRAIKETGDYPEFIFADNDNGFVKKFEERASYSYNL